MDDFSNLIQNSEKLLALPGGHKGLILKPEMANYSLSLLKNRFDFIQLISINKVSKTQYSELINAEYLMYHLANPYKKQQMFAFIPLVTGRKVNSTSSHWKNSLWYERQLHETSEISFKNNKSNWKMFEATEQARENFVSDLSRKNFQLRKLKWFKANSNHKYNFAGKALFYKKRHGKIVQGYVEIGQQRKKREDLYQSGSLYNSIKDFSLSAQINYLFSLKIGLEKYHSLVPSERYQALSIISLECQRILEHLESCTKILEKNKLFSPYRIYKKAHALFHDFFSPIVSEFKFDEHFNHIEDNLHELVKMLFQLKKSLYLENEFAFLKRRIDYGSFRKKDLINYSVTGVLAKSSGLQIDCRKSDPFYFYKDLDIKIPLGQQGSLYDQFSVRQFEIKESIQLILRVFDNLPIKSKNKDACLADLLKDAPGLLIGQNLERSNGLTNLVVLSNGNKNEMGLMRSPDFNQAQFLSEHLHGLSLPQLHQIGKGAGINSLEIDR